MMAAVNSNHDFDRLFSELQIINAQCHLRRKQLEYWCNECQKLFKPWPVEKKNVTDNTLPCVPSQNKIKTPAEEPEEVKLVDKVLARAQKLRHVHEKKQTESQQLLQKGMRKTDITNSSQLDPDILSPQRKENPVTNKRTAVKQTGREKSLSSSSNQRRANSGKSTVNKATIVGENVGIVSQSLVDKLLNKPPRENSHSTMVSNERPQSGAKHRNPPHKSGVNVTRNKHKPAHAKAPFKTEANIRVQSRARSSDRKSVFGESKSQKINDTLTKSKSYDEHRKLSIKSTDKRDGNIEDGDPLIDTSVNDSFGQEPKNENYFAATNPNNNRCLKTERRFPENIGIESISGEINDINITDKNISDGYGLNEEVLGQNQETNQIYLRKDGHKLSVPSKLRRTWSNNLKLRNKLQSSLMTVKVKDSLQPEESFLEKLQQYYDSREDDLGNSYKQIVEFTSAFCRLTSLLNKVHAESLSGNSTWQEVLAAKRTLEYVLRAFTDLEEPYTQILQESGNITQEDSNLQPNKRPSSPIIHNPNVWLTSHLNKVCIRAVGLRYQQKKDIIRHMTLSHEIQLKQLDLHILQESAKLLLPILRNTDANDKSFVMLYRSAYSLLCSGGQSFPAIIEEEIGEDDDDEEKDVYDF